MEFSAPNEWFSLLDVLEEGRGIAILIGATDTGKSTLAKFLIIHLCRRGRRVGLVDADIGQSFLGPPATIGASLFKLDVNSEIIFSSPEIFFVGSTTPEGHFPIHLKGVKRMIDKISTSQPDLILLDTTGFVLGEGGRELKRRKIELVSPQFILALQRGDEIEPILGIYEKDSRFKIYRLPLSPGVRPKSPEERRLNRTNKFQEYFKYATYHDMPIDGISIEGEVLDTTGAPLPLDSALRIHGLLIGLKDENDDTLALALTRHYSEEKKVLRVFTPLKDLERVKTIQVSSIRHILVYD